MYTAEDIRTAVRRQKKSWVSDWCDCFRFQIPYETQEGVPQSYSMEIGIEAVYSALGIPEQTWKKQDWKNPMVQRKLVTPFRETRMYQEICQDIAADMNRNGWIKAKNSGSICSVLPRRIRAPGSSGTGRVPGSPEQFQCVVSRSWCV